MLLVLVMMLSAMTVMVGADGTTATASEAELLPLSLQNLGWTKTTGNSLFGKSNYTLELNEDDPADKKLFVSSDDSWSGIEIVPADVMLGVTKYTVSMDTDMISATRLVFVCNTNDPMTNSGDYFGFNWSTRYECADMDSTRGEEYIDLQRGNLSGKITGEFDLETGVVNLYLDDELIKTYTTTHTAASRIVLVLRQAVGSIDNIEVVRGDKSNLGDASKQLYFEDFEGYRGPLTLTAENLGWTMGAWGAAWTNAGTKVLYTDEFGVGNKAAHLIDMTAEGDYSYIEFVSADKMAGVTNYTVTWTAIAGNITEGYDRETDSPRFWNSRYGMMVGVTGVDTGDWLLNYYDVRYRTVGSGYELAAGMTSYPKNTFNGLDADGNFVNVSNPSTEAATRLMWKDQPATYSATIDTILRTVTVVVTVDGVSFPAFVTEGTSPDVGAIGWKFDRSDVIIDDISVVNNETGAVIYAEDFESYIEPPKATRPAQDYTGKKAGETIFFDDFDNATTVDELYMTYDLKTMAGGSGFTQATVALSDLVNGTTCASISGNWSAVEVIPVEVFESYDVYTIQMDIVFESNGNRFDLLYQAQNPNSTLVCGWVELRYDPMYIQNHARNESGVSGSDDQTDITAGEVFHLTLEVDNNYNEAILYINGQYISTAPDLPNYRSALYICAQSAVGCVDNMRVSAGTYEDYLNYVEGGTQNPCTKCPEGCTACTGDDATCTCDHSNTGSSNTSGTSATTPPVTTTKPVTTIAPATTEAPATDAEAPAKNCKSSAAVSALVMLVAFGAAGVAMKKGKKD